MQELDVRDLACPGPVLRLRELLDGGAHEVRLWVADDLCRTNVTRFAGTRGADVDAVADEDGSFHVTVRASGEACPPAPPAEVSGDTAVAAVSAARHPLVVQIGSDAMGSGDPDLGRLLLRSFLKTLPDADHLPDALVFYNRGIMLCCEGSLVLEDLEALAAAGVEIITCGTCLNYFELADSLRVGRVTDMLEVVNILAGAGSLVRP